MKLDQGVVYCHDIRAGILRRDAQGYTFAYDPAYLAASELPAVSLTLPKTDIPYRSRHLFAFFAGLLAEGVQKERQCRELRIDEADDFTRLVETSAYGAIGAVYVKA